MIHFFICHVFKGETASIPYKSVAPLIFVLIFVFLRVQISECYFSLGFHPIEFKPWHNYILLWFYAVTFLKRSGDFNWIKTGF